MARVVPKIGIPLDCDLIVVEVVFAVGGFVRLEKLAKSSDGSEEENEYRLSVFWVKIGSWKH